MLAGLAVQVSVAALLLYVPIFKSFFLFLNGLSSRLRNLRGRGPHLCSVMSAAVCLPFFVKDPGSYFILAFQALPLVLVIGALSSLFFYWRILPYIVRVFSLVLQKTLNIGGALGLGASTTIFLGMVESPLL